MSIRTVIVIFLAVGCGVLSAMGFNLLLATQHTGPVTVETAPIVVAKAAIPRGRLISAELVEVKQWPQGMVPAGALTSLETALERAALQTMIPGEPVFDAKLAVKGAVGGMATLIPPGKRAYTIQTKTSSSKVAGFVLPGNLVDVLLTFRGQTNDETGGGSTTTLLQAVEVLAVGKNIEPVGQQEMVDAQEIESVTILVTPEQVARLDLGQTLGMLSLSLRNPNDTTDESVSAATINDIRFLRMKSGIDPGKVASALGSVFSAVSGLVPRAGDAPPPAPEAKPEVASTAILTLRGQNWGAVRVTVPNGNGETGQ
jgi:pilus assembly protein CpaB